MTTHPNEIVPPTAIGTAMTRERFEYLKLRASGFNTIREMSAEIERLNAQRNYLMRSAEIRACILRCDYDPAGSTTEYGPDPAAVMLFGEDALAFIVGCGPVQTHYKVRSEGLTGL